MLKCLSRRKRRVFIEACGEWKLNGVSENFKKKDHSKTKYLNCLKKDKSHTNSDSRQLSDSYGEEVKGEEQGGVKRQTIPVGNTDHQ